MAWRELAEVRRAFDAACREIVSEGPGLRVYLMEDASGTRFRLAVDGAGRPPGSYPGETVLLVGEAAGEPVDVPG